MQIALFYHSLLSDWNHGNAHFLRGMVSELLSRGHRVDVYEPADAWSVENLIRSCGPRALQKFRRAYPQLGSIRYTELDLDRVLKNTDLVIVHEWNSPELIQTIGEHRRNSGSYSLLFHDTHHRLETAPEAALPASDLSAFDGILAFGNVLKEKYLEKKCCRRVWTWHEAADTRVFKPVGSSRMEGDLVWISNWGDERTEELQEFLLRPVKDLKLRARVYGVQYPPKVLKMFEKQGIEYGGWLPNFEVPSVFGKFKLTVHIPCRPYVKALPGVPTIRPFEAMSCGIPLVSALWEDREHLFNPGTDYLTADTGKEMTGCLRLLLNNPDKAKDMAQRARSTILQRHTCAHRADELLTICEELGLKPRPGSK